MKIVKSISMILLLAIVFTGCYRSQINKENTNQSVSSNGIDTNTKISSKSFDEYIKYIEDNLDITGQLIGYKKKMSYDSVINLFGQYNQKVIPAKQNSKIAYYLRYDLICKDGYKFIDENGLDYIDIDGIAEGKVKIVLMIGFLKTNVVADYTIYYFDKNICQYRVNDECIRERHINVNNKTSNSFISSTQLVNSEKLDEYTKLIKDNITIGALEDKVISLLGQYNQKIHSLEPSEKEKYVYRYDILCEEGYKFIAIPEVDYLDINEIKEGLLKIQLFVGFTEENTVNSLAYYFLNTTNNKVYEYRVLTNGDIREMSIN